MQAHEKEVFGRKEWGSDHLNHITFLSITIQKNLSHPTLIFFPLKTFKMPRPKFNSKKNKFVGDCWINILQEQLKLKMKVSFPRGPTH